jgi:hypothetical protein
MGRSRSGRRHFRNAPADVDQREFFGASIRVVRPGGVACARIDTIAV